MIGAVPALFSSIYAADTVYLALVSIAGFTVVVVWLSIPLAQIIFRKSFLKNHSLDELSYKTPMTPALPYFTIVLLLISIVGIVWDFHLLLCVICIITYVIKNGRRDVMGKLNELLESADYLILDGALGTELENRGHDVSGKL